MVSTLRGPSGGTLVHAAGLYGSDEEFVRTFAPFCAGGVEHGEPTVVRLAKPKLDLLRSALDDPEGVVFLPSDGDHPSGRVGLVTALAHEYGARLGRPMRILGELQHVTGLARDVVVRYEAAVNDLLDDLPLFALCAYDTRVTPAGLQAELLRTHQLLATPGGFEPSSTYEAPDAVIASRTQPVSDPLEEGAPTFELVNPTPATTRWALRALAHELRLRPEDRDSLVSGASEVVTNALVHGRPPVAVRAWGRPGRAVVAVRDTGEGPRYPYAGLVPVSPTGREDGLGLWITHLLCPETSLSTVDGFTVRLAVGRPVPDGMA